VLANRKFKTRYGRERIRRLMRMYGLAVPVRGRRRNGRPHRGRIWREASNQRWCSDVLEIACLNGEVVHMAFALDCCDREALATVNTPYSTSGKEIRRLQRKAVFARFGNELPAEKGPMAVGQRGHPHLAGDGDPGRRS